MTLENTPEPTTVSAVALLRCGVVVAQVRGALEAVGLAWRAEEPDDAPLPGHGDPVMVICPASSLRGMHGMDEAPGELPTVALGTAAEALDAVAMGADFVVDPTNALLLEATLRAALRRGRGLREGASERRALDLIADAVVFADAQGTIRWANAACESLTGRTRAELLGRGLVASVESPLHGEALARALDDARHGRSWRGSLIGRHANGTAIEQVAALHPLRDPSGPGHEILFVSQFLAPALHGPGAEDAEGAVISGLAALAESERRLRTMMESAGDAIMVFDFDSAHAIEVNPAACALFGYTRAEFLALTGAALGGPEAADAVARMSAALRSAGFGHEPRHPMRRKDGTRFVADVRITSFEFQGRRQYLVIVRDVSDRVAHEHALEQTNRELTATRDRLVHHERLALLGQLAASVAHEINNPLQFMMGNTEQLRRAASVPPPPAVVEGLAEGIERIAAVTRSLLPFARTSVFQRETISLRAVVEGVEKMTAHLVRHRARLVVEVDAHVTIDADWTRISQLVMNLVTNAAHAIEEGRPQAHRILVRSELQTDRVTLVVSDDGRGIPRDVLDRIFEPFFTTRARDGGTGLGLALCLDIARQHGGDLRCESTEGVGTTFWLELPRAASPGDAVPPPVARPSAHTGDAGATRLRVLVVDDEALIAETYPYLLPDAETTVAVGGEEAVEFLSQGHDFDAIVCDLTMPGLDGPGLHALVTERWPALAPRFVFCSGGAVTARARDFLARVSAPLLDKPVVSSDLIAAVRAVAAAAPTAVEPQG